MKLNEFNEIDLQALSTKELFLLAEKQVKVMIEILDEIDAESRTTNEYSLSEVLNY